MPRPSKTALIDFAIPQVLSYGLIDRVTCPEGKPFVLVRDADKKGLRLRITKAGGKHWQFETRIKGKLFTRALGEWPSVSIDEAKIEAHRLRGLTETGTDPRELERQQQAEQAAALEAAAAEQARKAAEDAAAALTVREVWDVYLETRRQHWGDLHYRDHVDKASPGGEPSKKRGAKGKLTKPGPLAELMPLRLKDLDQARIEAWAANEGKIRPSSARLSLRLLTVFLTWCAEQSEYATLLPNKNPAKTKKARESLGKAKPKSDVLEKSQLKAWFSAVQKIQNPTVSAFLQVLLLTGARLNEVQTMRWDDVNTKWKGLSINDKMKETREVPLTPYVEKLITALKRPNEYVFASARALSMSEKNIARRAAKAAKRGKLAPVGEILLTSETGYISEPNTQHTRACRTVGIEGLTLHGLRRSFASLCEWLDIPGGVSAQIQGHAPQGVREQSYIRRPLDLLRLHHEVIEAWILEQAGIVFDPKAKPEKLREVAVLPKLAPA